ncbi:MAG: type II toxin-antitoxin system CcdA family antitoxin [Roseofilum sp. SBFL]|uniref:type II toxin-antitoxin system CcdA family antitoxin n=1 Tax=unclassified Roseofilum TaxID=2620099 RepID=UPI001B0C41E8|nr:MULTISPECIES: type II toxin-antitoxin system CcdA family antitoxin [unclassified Roseofilum]MBP0013708.1 type II toxin-antitoxin system CcdA family antitoxin [Roseofilum sp. SID3]MBP0037240.1 type II toxin-antitoxin system CcdA family antitoxin [Roseofilum sp. SID1]MBP0040917.1 type II toxin-antitoxin system CcdA family antitoxin [Roseofilum sp. SBFL]
MNDSSLSSEPKLDKVEISIALDAELLEQIQHLTNDPSRIIETAIRQWLKGSNQRDDELTRTLIKNPPLPPRGEWND